MNRSKARILIVDDNELLRTVLRKLLHTLGFAHVDDAEDGVAALEKLATGSWDAVITDWQMPRMDGITLLRHIRSSPALARLPVVIATGSHTFERVREACELGANGFIVKPFTALALEHQLSSAMGPVQAPLEEAAAWSG